VGLGCENFAIFTSKSLYIGRTANAILNTSINGETARVEQQTSVL